LRLADDRELSVMLKHDTPIQTAKFLPEFYIRLRNVSPTVGVVAKNEACGRRRLDGWLKRFTCKEGL